MVSSQRDGKVIYIPLNKFLFDQIYNQIFKPSSDKLINPVDTNLSHTINNDDIKYFALPKFRLARIFPQNN